MVVYLFKRINGVITIKYIDKQNNKQNNKRSYKSGN